MRIAALVVTLVGATSTAHAFCGFYVGSADARLTNHATEVVLMREGTRTVLSMRNDYQGPPENFAMVVPVPVVLAEENVKVLAADIFDRVDRLSSPRLVEYWEQDPCRQERDGMIGLGSLGTIGHGAGGGSGAGYGRGAQVRVESRFVVGEYDVVILSAADSNGLERWLRAHHYRIPSGASRALRPYVRAGMKFFVAKVNVERVTFEDGRAKLSPLRIHYDSEDFSLPVRLGMLNSSGSQDLVVHVLARDQRYEVANYRNVTIPTNLEVSDATRNGFSEYYESLFEQVTRQHPRSVVTEYAWQAMGCDPCPGPVLSASDLMTLGADVAIQGMDSQPPLRGSRVRSTTPEVRGDLNENVARRILRRHSNVIRYCHERQLQRTPGLQGTLVAELQVREGRVTASRITDSTVGNARVEGCIARHLRRVRFPADTGTNVVRYPIRLDATPRRFGNAGPLQNFVLTRLHYRYGQNDLGQDLVFSPAAPIVGGREITSASGALEQGAQQSSANNFQGRYIIRHPWEGEIACSNPVRGVWGERVLGAADLTERASQLASAKPEVDKAVETPIALAGTCSAGGGATGALLLALAVIARRRRM
ncbi:MAG: DUF2330 domain-containing protein [Myxococcota bacterium]